MYAKLYVLLFKLSRTEYYQFIFRFTYLEYEEAQPSWLISRTKLNNKNADDKINVGDKDDVLENDDVNDNLSETSLNTHEV